MDSIGATAMVDEDNEYPNGDTLSTDEEPQTDIETGASLLPQPQTLDTGGTDEGIARVIHPDGNEENGGGDEPSEDGDEITTLPVVKDIESKQARRAYNQYLVTKLMAVGSVGGGITTQPEINTPSKGSKTASIISTIQQTRQQYINNFGNTGVKKTSFSVGDKVLVNRQIMNIANNVTVPRWKKRHMVNKSGFPETQGRTPQEKTGPFIYVACEVKTVPSDENEPYFTVERYDTGQRQRVQIDWGMILLEDPLAIKAAISAARMTEAGLGVSSLSRESTHENVSCTDRMIFYYRGTVVPLCRRTKRAGKACLVNLLHGNDPFSCKIRFTGINLLVMCSTVFLFLEVAQLAFLPADTDDICAAIGTAIWVVLVLELVFEVLIRPKDYKQLIESDKAFRPSTARYIHKFYIVGEAIALVTYIPEIFCLNYTTDVCGVIFPDGRFALPEASADAVLGPTRRDSIVGRLVMGLMGFRFFGVIRHWKQMLINQTFQPAERQGIEKWIIPYDPSNRRMRMRRRKMDKKEDDDETVDSEFDDDDLDSDKYHENQRLKSAANIGTALISVNCQRVLILMILSVLVLPLFYSISHQNNVSDNMAKLLQSQNLVSTDGIRRCDYLETAIDSWLNMAIVNQPNIPDQETTYILWAQVLPVRCPFQNENGVITSCTKNGMKYREQYPESCKIWDNSNPPQLIHGNDQAVRNYFAKKLNIRGNGIYVRSRPEKADAFQFDALNDFNITVVFNQNPTIKRANIFQFFLLLITFFLGLAFLVIVQNGVNYLALEPIQRMLRIVLRYAEDPLWIDVRKRKKDNDLDDIGSFETEHLLDAITKISDLLRKCWGVAGAGIISSNLGREKYGQVAIFNPTVPGKQVYALFGFVTICGYSDLLKNLDSDVMILINDVAKVVHDEVYRWALGEHGQCNKNLGPCFLMVWRIGDFNEVQKKNKEAIEKLFRDKVYNTNRNYPSLRRRNRSVHTSRRRSTRATTRSDSTTVGSQEIQLESLPGIQGFTDRALLGMLKSFAGIHRDRSLKEWKKDFRLSSSVAACEGYTVDVVYGMDAGWAVEGAVGSEYKIDATYLSPHVNMASRMMGAAKQYGVTILLSKAVEKLLSGACRKKLRHLDCVYVKGSAVKQDIYTYDARHQGVDFFLLERAPEQADRESEAYNQSIWDRDPDVRAMRQHVSDEFLEAYHAGVDQYLSGRWSEASESFRRADTIMIRTVVEEGYIELDMEDLEDRIFDENDLGEDIVAIRREFGDGACRTLSTYIDRRNGTPPDDWDGVRQLFSK
ncbi:unnamed protein product [Pseudo-nitzschia multistriata]|uniref:Uncharacterized protein n=1 Tax=Pseudo-nitzschia multistriata TaxID=183589 RepID=A0A448YVM3_9STRA|nr:unnamed protein product [Pseudo-nitzschia multistriata]